MIKSARIANLDQICPVREGLVGSARNEGNRFIEIQPYGGLHIRVLPDRALDISTASFEGVPLSWCSAVGEAPPLPTLTGHDWIDAFGGGLLTTCGLDNVGEPSEGIGLHGSISHVSAEHVTVERVQTGSEVSVVVRGVLIDKDQGGRRFELARTITVGTESGSVMVDDVVVNKGKRTEPAPLLYHVNLGWPLLDDETRVLIDGAHVAPVFGDLESLAGGWQNPGVLSDASVRVTVEHVFSDHPPVREVSVLNERLGIKVDISWSADTLPRLFQWVWGEPGVSVLAIEPSNATTAGRGVDRGAGRLALLRPGETRRTWLRIAAVNLIDERTIS